MSNPKITLHHLEASRSLRVLWLLEYLNLPYEIDFHARDGTTRYAANSGPNTGKGLSAIHPLGRSPVLTIEENGEKIIIAEAGAVLNYLLHHYPKAGDPSPTDKTQRGQDLSFWLQFGESSLMLHAIPFMYGGRGGHLTQDGNSVFEKVSARGLKADLDFLETSLEESKTGFLMGHQDIGPADICTEVSIELIDAIMKKRDSSYWSALGITLGFATQSWLEKCKASDLYKKSTQKEVDLGGKVEKGEDWLKPLYG